MLGYMLGATKIGNPHLKRWNNMYTEFRSVSLKCKCGKIHTYFGQDANDMMQMLDACSTTFFKRKPEISVINMMKNTVKCCDSPLLTWCLSEYDVMEETS